MFLASAALIEVDFQVILKPYTDFATVNKMQFDATNKIYPRLCLNYMRIKRLMVIKSREIFK